MVRHPEVYRKAQEEIDRVVGPDRLPDFDDRDSLPYLNAIVKEVYRWVCKVVMFAIAPSHSFRWHVPVPGGRFIMFPSDESTTVLISHICY